MELRILGFSRGRHAFHIQVSGVLEEREHLITPFARFDDIQYVQGFMPQKFENVDEDRFKLVSKSCRNKLFLQVGQHPSQRFRRSVR